MIFNSKLLERMGNEKEMVQCDFLSIFKKKL